MNQLERTYRTLYWEKNELELILPDTPDPTTVRQFIRKLGVQLTIIINQLGYTPSA